MRCIKVGHLCLRLKFLHIVVIQLVKGSGLQSSAKWMSLNLMNNRHCDFVDEVTYFVDYWRPGNARGDLIGCWAVCATGMRPDCC